MAFQTQLSAQAGELIEAITGISQKVRRRENRTISVPSIPFLIS